MFHRKHDVKNLNLTYDNDLPVVQRREEIPRGEGTLHFMTVWSIAPPRVLLCAHSSHGE